MKKNTLHIHDMKCHLKIGKHTATGRYLDIEVVGCQDQLKESALVNLAKKLVKTEQMYVRGKPLGNLRPKRKCHLFSSPCSRRPLGVGGHPENLILHCFLKNRIIRSPL